ncbi:MAG TPA: hypothetical protein DCK85_13455 [Ktedonobacter sp.]|nr:hypothetical protein [Ktedonobacter sp.]
MALPSLRLEQRMKLSRELGQNDHYMVAEKAAQVVGVVGLTVGTGRVRHSGSLFVYVVRQYQGPTGCATSSHLMREAAPRGKQSRASCF